MIQASVTMVLFCLLAFGVYRKEQGGSPARSIGVMAENSISQTLSQKNAPTEQMQEANLYPRVNYVENPVGIDTQQITFSWETDDFVQSAYRIVVEDEQERCVWDSKVVSGSDTIQIAYEGEPLSDLTRYRYRIFSYEEQTCYVSPEAFFETAYVNEDAFDGADFIAMQAEEDIYWNGQPVFYKTFNTGEAALEKAYFIGSALGVYDAYINGKRVGTDEYKPGWTDYQDTLLYQLYDVTDLVREQEENHIAIQLGTGWWCGRNAFGTYGFHQPALIGKLLLVYADGTRQAVCTDASWRYCKDTRVQFADFFNGETVDLQKPGVEEISRGQIEGLTMREAAPSNDFTGTFRSYYGYQNRRREDLTRKMEAGYLYGETADNGSTFGEVVKEAEWNAEPEDGIWIRKGQTLIVDLGQNIAGTVELTFSTGTENEIVIQFAEMCNDSGQEERGNDGPMGSLYRKNYRSAETTVRICTGAAEHVTYSPSLFFTGFRYFSVTAAEDVWVSNLKGICIGNDSPETGSFTCDNEKINRLYENVRWSQRNNFTLIATDCPQRDERLGWTGDLQSFSTTSLYNQDLFSFYRKWDQDFMDAQTAEGAYTDTVPAVVTTGSGNGGWAEAGIMVPLHVYDKYGDKEELRRVYPSMKRYMAYLESVSSFSPDDKKMGPGTIYGDWLAAQETDSTFLSALWYAADASYMIKIAGILGENEDQKAYETLFAKLREYIGQTYLHDGFAQEMSQTELCFLLRYHLLTERQETEAADALADSVKENEYRIMTGFAGTPILLHTLTECGMTPLAYRILLCEENPSWMQSISQGATTIWERYDSYTEENGFADFAMNSFDHFNEGSVAQWIYEDLLGIRVNLSEEVPIRICPNLPDAGIDLHEAQGSYHSVFGEIAVHWCIVTEEGKRKAKFEITIPANVKARVRLPIKECEDKILSGGQWEFEGEIPERNSKE